MDYIQPAVFLFDKVPMTASHDRPAYADILVIGLDILTFAMLTFILQWRKLSSDNPFYRACWGILAIGTLWQSLVSGARVIHYYLPDWLWSGWVMQDMGLFGVVAVIFCRALREHRH